MLSQIERTHLKKLTKNTNLEHLKPHPHIHSIQHPEDTHFSFPLEPKLRRRQIFYQVQYSSKEKEVIREVKGRLRDKNVGNRLGDEVILKHVYSANWKVQKTVERVERVMRYHTNQKVTRFDASTVEALEKGQIYTYGHDKNYHPIVVMRMDRFDLSQDIDEHFNSIYYLMMVVLGFRMVPYHAQKNILIIDLNDMSLSKVPFKYMFACLDRIQTCYCGLMQKIYVYNGSGIGNLWKAVSYFLSEAQKRRVCFVQKGREAEVLDFIDQEELQERYGGKLANLTSYWPPRSTRDSLQMKCKETTDDSVDSDYESVINDYSFFGMEGETTVEKTQCSCDIY